MVNNDSSIWLQCIRNRTHSSSISMIGEMYNIYEVPKLRLGQNKKPAFLVLLTISSGF